MILSDKEIQIIRQSIEEQSGLDEELLRRCRHLLHMEAYDEAVRSAFVLLEERLRKAIGEDGMTGTALAQKALNPNNDSPPAMIFDYIRNFRQKGLSILSDMRKDEQTIFVNWAQNIVDRYGSLLQDNPAKIKNVADLPCPKEDLKVAIKVLLPAYLAKGSDDTVDLLKDRYVRLGAFQEISQEDKEAVTKESDEIDQQTESTDTSLFSTYQKYMQIIVSEQKILLEDINTFVDDLQFPKRE